MEVAFAQRREDEAALAAACAGVGSDAELGGRARCHGRDVMVGGVGKSCVGSADRVTKRPTMGAYSVSKLVSYMCSDAGKGVRP